MSISSWDFDLRGEEETKGEGDKYRCHEQIDDDGIESREQNKSKNEADETRRAHPEKRNKIHKINASRKPCKGKLRRETAKDNARSGMPPTIE